MIRLACFLVFGLSSCAAYSIQQQSEITKKQRIPSLLKSMTTTSEPQGATVPRWDPEQQIYVDGIVPENAKVKALIEDGNGSLRLFGYGSLCWNPGTGTLSKPEVKGSLGRARGYKRCWAQKSTDHRGRPAFPGIVCTLLEDSEVEEIRKKAHLMDATDGQVVTASSETMTEGIIFTIPPELVDECLEELDFREKGGYARDVIEVVEDATGETHQALLYRGTPQNPAFWPRALLDLPMAAAIISVSEGPSGTNDVYLNSLDHFLSDTHTIAAENDDTMLLANMVHYFQKNTQLYFLFGCGSNQHDQLLLNRPNNGAMLKGEDTPEMKEIVFGTPRGDTVDQPVSMFAGGGHSGLLTESGKLYLWGWNDYGQCGTSTTSEQKQLSFIEALANVSVETAALGFSHTLVIERETRRVFAFGSNERGQVSGMSSTKEETPMTPSFLEGERAVAVAAGLFHSAVVTETGEVIVFGCGQFGQSLSTVTGKCGVGRWKPTDGSRLVDVTCGRRHTAVVDDQGRVWTFGENKYGQLGRSIDGKFDAHPTVVNGLSSFATGSKVKVDCGWSHTIVHVQTPDGESMVYGWGRNDKGQLGLGSTDHVLTPVQLFTNTKVYQVACGSEFTMLATTDGEILGCGWNEHGNLGTGTTSEDQTTLEKITGARVVGPPGLYDGQVAIAVGGSHILAAKVAN